LWSAVCVLPVLGLVDVAVLCFARIGQVASSFIQFLENVDAAPTIHYFMGALHAGLLRALVVRGWLRDHGLNAWRAAILLAWLEEEMARVLLMSLDKLALRRSERVGLLHNLVEVMIASHVLLIKRQVLGLLAREVDLESGCPLADSLGLLVAALGTSWCGAGDTVFELASRDGLVVTGRDWRAVEVLFSHLASDPCFHHRSRVSDRLALAKGSRRLIE